MKKLVSLFLFLVLMLNTTLCFADIPASVEAPRNVAARNDDGTIRLRWTVPQSVMDLVEEADNVLYCIDWKVNDGPWHFDTPEYREDTYDFDEDAAYIGFVGNLVTDENNTQEVFINHWSVGLDEDIDFSSEYTFRMRFVSEYDGVYTTSPYSNEASIGGNEGLGEAPTSLEAPLKLQVAVLTDLNGRPYFSLTWTNPASASKANESVPIMVKVDYKVGNGRWFSEETDHDWWGADIFGTSLAFDPIERDLEDSIVIDKNTYYFRILYAYEPSTGNKVYSAFSNIAIAGVEPYELSKASEWAVTELNDGAQLGLITEKIKGNLKGDITREEFAEAAVLFYEKVTGEKAVAAPSDTFTDCTNPEVLKAFSLGITTGVGGGRFAPDNLLPRQQMAAMITRTMDACFDNFTMDVAGVEDFKDQALIQSWAAQSTKFMAKYKITLGDGKGNFLPENNCTREQAIAFLVRAYNYRDQYLTD